MARRRLLGDDAWARLLDPPTDELEIARLCTLTTDDLALIGNRRTDATRLGYTLVLLYLRHPGRVLEIGEVPPDALLVYVAGQLGAPASAFADYAARDTARREHLAELMTAGGYTVFSRPLAHEMVSFLAAAAQTIVRPGQLAGILVEELCRRRVLLPSPLVLEAVIRHARQRAEALARGALTGGLDEAALARLDGLLTARLAGKLTWLGWLRNAPQSPAPGNVGKLLERLVHVRSLGIDRSRASALPTVAFERLADEAARLAVRHLAGLNPARRHAVLAAAAMMLESALTDAVIVMFGKLMAQYGKAAERKSDERAAASMREVHADLRVFALSGRAMLEAKARAGDLDRAVAAGVGWMRFERAVARAEALSTPELLDPTADLVARHASVKRFGPALLTCILADGINLGLTRMAETCRGASLRQLALVHDWYVSEGGYALALGRLIDAHRALPLARVWGDGTKSSSDGQHFFAGGRGEAAADVNARHGNEPGVSFYTHVSDQYGPFHTKVIAATAGEAPHVLDGLLYHQSGLSIDEHAVDTGGVSDHCFGLLPFFGYRFAPRMRDLRDRRLHLPPGLAIAPLLAHWTDHKNPVDVEHVAAHWEELLRMATSIRAGTVTASAMLKKMSAYPRQNGLAVALRELGRLDRSLYMLRWLLDLDLRRRAQAGLNKGEARNALARAVFFCQLGELRDRTFENQVYRASGLNLMVAAVILWNTRYLQLAAEDLGIGADTMKHVAPLGWEHLSFTGDYAWETADLPGPGQLRPLRTKASLLAA